MRQKGVESNALLCIDKSLFSKLLGSGTISVAQAKLFEAYHEDPYSAMRDFLIAHPDFIDLALKTDDPKIRQRAELFLEKDPYQIGSNPV